MLSLGIRAQNISFTDANFKAKLLSASPSNTVAKNLNGNYFKIDANDDGDIQVNEAQQVSELNVSIYGEGTGISYTTINSIDGIKSFVALKKFALKIGNSNHYSGAVDLSGMTNLENLDLSLVFSTTANHDINVSNCTALKTFVAGYNGASPALSFSGCSVLNNAKIIGYNDVYGTPTVNIGTLDFNNFTSLKDLYIENINLNTLLLQGCNALENLTLKEYFTNAVSSLINVANLPNLKTITLNKYNVTLDAHNCPNLISVTGGNITNLNVKDCTNLVDLKANSYNNTMNVNNCINLKTISGAANCSSIDLSNLQNLDSILFFPLDCMQQQTTLMSSLNVQNCPKLRKIATYELKLTSLDVSNLPKLESLKILHCDYSPASSLTLTQINASNCPMLTTFDIKGSYKIQSINLQNCSSLSNIILHNGNSYEGRYAINNINLTGCNNFTDLDIRRCNFSSLDLPNLPNLKTLDCSDNYLNNLDFSNLQSLETIICGKNNLTTLNIHDLPNLINFDYSDGTITSLDFQNLPKVKNLVFNNNQLSNMVLNNMPLIEKLVCRFNSLTNLNLQNLPIKYLDCRDNQLINLVINNLNNLTSLFCSNNQLTSLNLTSNSNISFVDCSYNQLSSLDTSGLQYLDELYASHNQLQNLNIAGRHLLHLDCSYNNLTSLNLDNTSTDYSFNCSHNQLTTLDFSKYYHGQNTPPSIDGFICSDNPQLSIIILKNGISEFGSYYDFSNLPNLNYVCCDDSEIPAVQAMISQNGYTGCNVNSYCNITPGGNYNTITGTVRFDENNNGCDTNDEFFEHMKLKINDGTSTGETFVKSDGTYNFFTQTGNFTVTTEPENPSLYTVTPSSFTVNFTNDNNNISTQNICVTKNGNVKDLEIIIAPVTDARPGFDAKYKLIWRNKGNATLSGKAILSFDTSRMTFVTSSLPSVVSGNEVTFDFVNLKPYGNTASEITFNINPPTHPTNPVNNGDILNFTANVTPLSGDVNPEDNSFNFKQTVVNSFDPNDITCLEGNQIPVSMVGKDLHYVVNFENTGTASAVNIVVEMDIDPNDYDINSLQLQNTSHNTFTKIKGNKVEFMMKNINLAASAHGNIAFKIKTKNNLVNGDSVMNKANIYFDYNFPVATNEAVTNIGGTTLAVTESVKDKDKVNVYPNPTKGDVNISADSIIKSIEIYDAQGRIIQKQTGINAKNTKVSLHNNISGLYMFKIITEQNTLMKKVIKN